MGWTREFPSEPGLYWCKSEEGTEIIDFDVITHTMAMFRHGKQWFYVKDRPYCYYDAIWCGHYTVLK